MLNSRPTIFIVIIMFNYQLTSCIFISQFRLQRYTFTEGSLVIVLKWCCGTGYPPFSAICHIFSWLVQSLSFYQLVLEENWVSEEPISQF